MRVAKCESLSDRIFLSSCSPHRVNPVGLTVCLTGGITRIGPTDPSSAAHEATSQECDRFPSFVESAFAMSSSSTSSPREEPSSDTTSEPPHAYQDPRQPNQAATPGPCFDPQNPRGVLLRLSGVDLIQGTPVLGVFAYDPLRFAFVEHRLASYLSWDSHALTKDSVEWSEEALHEFAEETAKGLRFYGPGEEGVAKEAIEECIRLDPRSLKRHKDHQMPDSDR